MSTPPQQGLKVSSCVVICGILSVLGLGLFGFSSSAYASSSVSVSNTGKISFNKVQPSSSGSITTGQDTLSISTDCPAGVNVYVSGLSGKSTELINNTASSNNTIATVNSISTPTALSNNTWGLTTSSTDASNNRYLGLPAFSDAMNHLFYAGNDATLPIYYGAKVTNTLATGTYTGEVLYTVTVNNSCLTYTVNFDKNAEDAQGTMSPQEILISASAPLSKNNFIRPGYKFLGWNTDKNAATALYTDEQSVSALAAADGEITLFAIWEEPSYYNITYMQDMTPEICSSLTTPDKTATDLDWTGEHSGDNSFVPRRTLIDSRDGKKYLVSKLADGNCWMSQDLKLDLSPDKTFRTYDTNLYNDGNFTPLNSTMTDTNLTWSSEYNQILSYKPSNENSYFRNGDTPSSSPSCDGDECLWEAAGNYYNFYTTVGADYYWDLQGRMFEDSICPKGWKLPDTYSTLLSTYEISSNLDGRNKILSTPLNFTLGGRVTTSQGFNGAGTQGLYWGRYSNSSWYYYYAFGLSIWNNGVKSDNEIYKNQGHQVRCIARSDDTVTVTLDANGGEVSPNALTLRKETPHISLPMPTREGYKFVGWYWTNAVTSYGYISNNTYANNYLHSDRTVYAQWRPENDNNFFDGISFMQEMTPEICNKLTTPSKNATMLDWNGSHAGDNMYVPRTVLIDERDGKEYLVSKLADGNCWMSQSLQMYIGSSYIFSNSDSNVTTKTKWQSVNSSSSGTQSKWGDTVEKSLEKDHTALSESEYTYYQQGKNHSSSPTDNTNQYLWEHGGSVYNLTIATAGTGTYNGTSVIYNDSICPKGWRLPYAEGDKSYSNLISSAYGIENSSGSLLRQDPFNFNLSGYFPYQSTSMSGREAAGYYWTSATAANQNNVYIMQLSENYVNPSTTSSKGNGYSIRCVAL